MLDSNKFTNSHLKSYESEKEVSTNWLEYMTPAIHKQEVSKITPHTRQEIGSFFGNKIGYLQIIRKSINRNC